jgi:hypothetical protein
MVAQNASFNCNAAKVLVTAKGWDKREVFLRKVDEALAAAPPRKAYYPGAEQRYKAFLEHYPKAHVVGKKQDGVVPWTILPNVSSSPDEYALRNEAFCGVLAEVALEATTPKEFMDAVLPFANDTCWGTLSTCVLIHPSTERELSADFDRLIAGLHYGGIGINVWPGLIYGLVVTTWGAFPGHPPTDIQSGAGVVHNTFLFDHPERSVLRAPFRMKPVPVYFADNKNLREIGKRLVKMEGDPGWGKLVSVAFAALKGLRIGGAARTPKPPLRQREGPLADPLSGLAPTLCCQRLRAPGFRLHSA